VAQFEQLTNQFLLRKPEIGNVTPAKAGVYHPKTGFPLSREWQNVVFATDTN